MLIVLCVTNDIATDQRLKRITFSLRKLPAEVMIVGTVFPDSLSLKSNEPKTHRIKMIFRKGPLFYAEYNIRLFFFLLFTKADILVANDLDTLTAVFLASRFKHLPLVYDSHEYFTEVPELIGRNCVKKFWEFIEAILLPGVKFSYTVSSSIAKVYKSKYGISMHVIRNLPFAITEYPKALVTSQQKFHLKGEKMIIYQGALNIGRGLELAIRAMQFVENTRLYIAGAGDIEKELRQLTNSLKLHNKVRFMGRLQPDELLLLTEQADLGISLEEKKGLNYEFALPNKLFDYIQAHVPVLVTDLPEMAFVVRLYDVGRVINTVDPLELARIINDILNNSSLLGHWHSNLKVASTELCWEREERKLLNVYKKVLASR